MPERLAYDEAMLFSSARLKVQDPELKQGKVETVSIPTAIGTVQRPWGIEGGFAVVYKFRTRSGPMRALRCFRVPVPADTRSRYERIGAYFQTQVREITAGFKYHDAAIIVKEQGKPQNLAYPVIEMDWIEGATLVEKVDELCKRRDKAALKDLAAQWLHILRTMRNAHIAHGDLSGVNVMVQGDGKLLLVDYDGVYIPELAGLSQVVLGQEDYQHPQMAQRKFHEHMDDFSALVIYAALIVLAARPEMWNKYARLSPDGKLEDVNLLFRKQDFQTPHLSALIREMEQMPDAHIRAVIQKLKQACQQTVNDIQFPFALIDPDYERKRAQERLEHALSTDDDEKIAISWSAALEHYGPAQQYRSRVQLAQQRVNALRAFRTALQTGDMQQIIDNYDTVLDTCQQVTAQERQLHALIYHFFQADQRGSDEALLSAADALLNTQHLIAITFTPEQRQRVAQARQRKYAAQNIQAALQSKNVESIAKAYAALQQRNILTSEESKQAEMAATFVLACGNNDDGAIIEAYDTIQSSTQQSSLIFTAEQEQRVLLAQQRVQKLSVLRTALASRSPVRTAEAYDALLDGYAQVSPEERAQLALARMLAQAFATGHEDMLLAAYTAVEQSSYRTFFVLTEEEQRLIALARQQKDALRAFQAALGTRSPRQIVAAYEPVLDSARQVSTEERAQLDASRLFLAAYYAGDDEALVRADDALQQASLSQPFILSPQELQRVALARQRQHAVEIFRVVVRSGEKSARKLVDAYDMALLGENAALTHEERERLEAAHRYLAMYEKVRQGIAQDNDDVIRHAYDPALAQLFAGISPGEQKSIDRAMLAQELEDLLENKAYGQALRMARTIQTKTGRNISDSLRLKLQVATMRFIKEQTLWQMTIQIEARADGNYILVRWQWPLDDLIQRALLLWHSGRPLERSLERNLRKQDPEIKSDWVERRGNGSDGMYMIPISWGRHIYVQGYTAIRDEWDRERRWRFSDGAEPTSYIEGIGSHVS